jgi:hypothetical protein
MLNETRATAIQGEACGRAAPTCCCNRIAIQDISLIGLERLDSNTSVPLTTMRQAKFRLGGRSGNDAETVAGRTPGVGAYRRN